MRPSGLSSFASRSVGFARGRLMASELTATCRKALIRNWSRRCSSAELVTAVRDDDFDRAATLIRGSTASSLHLDLLDMAAQHGLRQAVHRQRDNIGSCPTAVSERSERLDRDGIIAVPSSLEPNQLASIRDDFSNWVDRLERRRSDGAAEYSHYDQQEFFASSYRSFVSNDAVSWSSEVVLLAASTQLFDLARTYLGGPPLFQRATAMRYLPAAAPPREQFTWHHDLEDKRFKVMVLLNDVETNGQPMRYCVGSHRVRRRIGNFVSNGLRIDEEQAKSGRETFVCEGVAGDAFVFDSNGAHTASRSATAAIRDVITLEYTVSPSLVFGAGGKIAGFDRLDSSQRTRFEVMNAKSPPWQMPSRRSLPNWIETLPDVNQWRPAPAVVPPSCNLPSAAKPPAD